MRDHSAPASRPRPPNRQRCPTAARPSQVAAGDRSDLQNPDPHRPSTWAAARARSRSAVTLLPRWRCGCCVSRRASTRPIPVFACCDRAAPALVRWRTTTSRPTLFDEFGHRGRHARRVIGHARFLWLFSRTPPPGRDSYTPATLVADKLALPSRPVFLSSSKMGCPACAPAILTSLPVLRPESALDEAVRH